VTVFESLNHRAGLVVFGAASFVVVIGAVPLAGGEPLVQPQADAGIVVGAALMTLFPIVRDRRGGD
jgi:hypothetical protein